jgi:glucan phosphoethanolaminetransferase (alkaline phosphatase superfamily)
MSSLTSLAKTTIIVSWLLVGLAFISTIAQLIWLRVSRRRFSVVDFCLCVALVIGSALVSQTTWAMVDEGAGKHQYDIKKGNVAAVAKVIDPTTIFQRQC